jgi:hypothetical protein
VGTVEQKPASLLMQLAQLLEDTEPDAYSVGNQENRGVFHTVAQTIGAGLGSGRKVLYDLMIMLGDTGGKPPGRSS